EILFVDERQFVLVHRLVAESDTERIEDAVLRIVTLLPRRNVERHQLVVDDRHHTGSQENTSLERSSGVNDAANAPLSCASSFSGVQPSGRCSVRMGGV